MDDDHDLVADIDSDTLIRIVKFLKRGKAPGPDNIHNEVLRLGTATSLFHHLARLFTSSIQIGYIPTAWKLATLRMLLKPRDNKMRVLGQQAMNPALERRKRGPPHYPRIHAIPIRGDSLDNLSDL